LPPCPAPPLPLRPLLPALPLLEVIPLLPPADDVLAPLAPDDDVEGPPVVGAEVDVESEPHEASVHIVSATEGIRRTEVYVMTKPFSSALVTYAVFPIGRHPRFMTSSISRGRTSSVSRTGWRPRCRASRRRGPCCRRTARA